VTGLCAPRRLCQPPACSLFCLACLTSREPWTCTHARMCAQACYANHLPTVEAMILSAIAANGSDPWQHSPAGDRPHGGLPTACLLRHLGLPARRYLLTTPICENALNCQGAAGDLRKASAPQAAVPTTWLRRSRWCQDVPLWSRLPEQQKALEMRARTPLCPSSLCQPTAHGASHVPCPSLLCARARYVPELALCPSSPCQLSAHGARHDAHEPTNCHHS
jgi:hypothetical protein